MRTIRAQIIALLVLCAASFSNVLPQTIAPQFKSFLVPYPAEGVELGQGWDSVLDQRKDAHCLDFGVSKIEKATSKLAIQEIRDSYSLKEAKESTVSAKGRGFGVKVRGSHTSYQERTLDTDLLNYLINFRVEKGGTFISPSRPKDTPSLRDTTDTIERHVTISPNVQNSLSKNYESGINQSDPLTDFAAHCGDYFVSAIHRGTQIHILATYGSTNRKEQDSVRTKVRVSGFGAAASLDSSRSKEIGFDSTKFHFVVHQEGFSTNVPLKVISKFEDVKNLIEGIDLNTLSENPGAFMITLTPYAVLPDWGKLPGFREGSGSLIDKSAQSLELLDLMYSAYRDIYALVDRIDRSVTRNELVEFELANIIEGSSSDYASHVVDMYGGVKRLRLNKAVLQVYLSLMERAFDICFRDRICNETAVIQKVGEDLRKTQAGMGKLCMKWNSEECRKSAFAEEAKEVAAQLVAIGPMREGVQMAERGGEADPVDGPMDGLYREFYRVLASTPIPSSIFDPKKVTWSKFGSIDIAERKKLTEKVIRELLYYLITTQAKRNLSSRSGIGGVLSAT